MAIEFHCPQCNQLLRTPDGTGGKQARCPQCGAVANIPMQAPEGEPDEVPPLADQDNAPPTGDPPVGAGSDTDTMAWAPSEEDTANPYAAPAAASHEEYRPADGGTRNGPPWERDGYSVRSFWDTATGVLGSPTELFGQMRRSGGLGAPILFALIGGMTGSLISTLWWSLLQAGVFSFAAMAEGADPGEAAATVVMIPFMIMQAIVGGLIGVLMAIFVGSALIHLALMMLGGANYPFETTFRVVSYTNGAVGLLQLIPCIGPLIGLVLYYVATIVGVAETQEISGGKAAAAVFLPLLLCAGLCFVPIAVLAFIVGIPVFAG